MNKLLYILPLIIVVQPASHGEHCKTSATPSDVVVLTHRKSLTTLTPRAPRARRQRPQASRAGRAKVETAVARPAGAKPHLAEALRTIGESGSSAAPCVEAMRAARSAQRGARPRAPRCVTFVSGESLPIVRGPVARSRTYLDPNNSGNPLLDTRGANRRKMLSPNFSVDEYARSGGNSFPYSRIDPQHVTCLQDIRDLLGRPVRIFSGYRPFKYNLDLYRARGETPTRSQHSSGRGTDIRVTGMTGSEIGEVAVDACGPHIGIGLGLDYAHLDSRGRAATWKYSGVSDRQLAALRLYQQTRIAALRERGRRRRNGPSRATVRIEKADGL